MTQQEDQTTAEATPPGRKELVVAIHDEDAGGEPYKVPGQPDTLVGTIIEEFYSKLGTTRQDGDRLYCLANGGDVFPHAAERLGEYAHRECDALEWGFARKTGGA